jgi:hypothetical protein
VGESTTKNRLSCGGVIKIGVVGYQSSEWVYTVNQRESELGSS